jgi:hypothetical protein
MVQHGSYLGFGKNSDIFLRIQLTVKEAIDISFTKSNTIK